MTDLTKFGFDNPCKSISDVSRFGFMWEWMKQKKQILGTEILAKLISTFGTIGRSELEWFYKLIYIYPLKRNVVTDMHGIPYDEWYTVIDEAEGPKDIKASVAKTVMGGDEHCQFCEDKAVKLLVFRNEEIGSVPMCDNDGCFQRLIANHMYESFKVVRLSGWDTADEVEVVEDETGV